MAALCEILSLAEDHLVDIPKFWDFIAQVCVLPIKFSLFQMVFVTQPLPDRGPGAGALRAAAPVLPEGVGHPALNLLLFLLLIKYTIR